MNPSLSPGRIAALLLCLWLMFAPGAHAQTLPSGQYQAVAILGPVYLDGRYPCLIGEAEAGSLALSTSPTGALTGVATLAGEAQDVVGQITSGRKKIRLTLKGKAEEGRFSVKAVLQGGSFVGTATMRGQTGPCRIDVTGVAPISASYDLALTSKGNGEVTGTGTLVVARTEIPVTASGRFVRGKGSLEITGKRTFLRTRSAQLEGTGFTGAKWTSQGFGALIALRHLQFAPPP